MEPRDVFALNLRERRLVAGLSQEALGKVSGMHFTEISRLERARRDPRLGTIVKLARALDIKSSELLVGSIEARSGGQACTALSPLCLRRNAAVRRRRDAGAQVARLIRRTRRSLPGDKRTIE